MLVDTGDHDHSGEDGDNAGTRTDLSSDEETTVVLQNEKPDRRRSDRIRIQSDKTKDQ